MAVLNAEFWWDPTPGVISYAVTITPSLGGASVFTGSVPNNYINTTTLPLTAGVNYDVNIVATCGTGSTTTNTYSLYMNPDGTYISTTNYCFLTYINGTSWGTITNVATDTGTSIACSIAPGQTGMTIDPGSIITTGSGPSPYIRPMWYTNKFLITIQNPGAADRISNFRVVRNSVIEGWSSRMVIPSYGGTVVVPISLTKPPQNTDNIIFVFQ